MKIAGVLLFVSITAACGGDPTAAEDTADLSPVPSAFALQFTGSYLGAGSFTRLDLHPDGTWSGRRDGRSERGRFRAGRGRALPLGLLLEGPVSLRCSVAAYDGRLLCGAEALRLQRPATSDEELCDRSAGRWTDDDPDPVSGLYCVCPGGRAFIPAEGGCVPTAP